LRFAVRHDAILSVPATDGAPQAGGLKMLSTRRLLQAAIPILLTSCATAAGPATSPGYVRTDGHAVDAVQLRAVMAQCQGEAARGVTDYVTGEGAVPWVAGMVTRSSKETTLANACMARNGYVAPQ
jgi:hypothetical protein